MGSSTSIDPLLHQMEMGSKEQTGTDPVRIISRRMIKPRSNSQEDVNTIHLTPWDLRLIAGDYIQKGILLPKPPAGGVVVDNLASSFARALSKSYLFAGRLVVEHHDGGTVSVLLQCNGQGAEFVHAAAAGVTVADIVQTIHTPSVVWAFYPLNHVVCADAATESLPVLSAQVTELADGLFIGMSMNHSVGDGTAFWEFFNTWSEMNRGGVTVTDLREPAPPVHQRYFIGTSPVPIRLPFSRLQDVFQRSERPTVQECFFTFSAASIQRLKARANSETVATVTISSLQALLAHLWLALCRARRLPSGQETSYYLLIGCRGRVKGIPQGYTGNAVVSARASSTVGEILDKGLGWTAWQLNRVVASFDEAAIAEWLNRWTREPDFVFTGESKSLGGAAVATGSSPRFDVFGNNFGWGKPLAVRSGSGNKMDGKATVFEGPDGGGSMSLEVCIAPDALHRLVADEEFMDAVTSMPMK